MHICIGEVPLWDIESRVQGAGCRWSARRVSDAASVREIVRKHDCALPTLYPKHSNAWGAIIRASVRASARLLLGLGLG